MCFDRDFAPESKVSDEQIDELQRELINESETVQEIHEFLRSGIYSAEAAGLLLKHEFDRLGEIAESRLLEALAETEDCE